MKTTAPPTFEQALADLEGIVRELEDGPIGLDQALERYERGVGLLKHCYGLLQQAEQKILILTGVSDNGQPLTTPFDPDTETETKPAPEVNRRSRRKPNDPVTDQDTWFGQ